MSVSLERRRLTTFILITVILIAAYPLLRELEWHGSKTLHTVMESIATILALFVGVLSLIHYYTNKKEQLFLLIGVGFFGTAFLDGYHAIVTSVLFDQLFPSAPSSLIPWSWIASRLFLSLFLFWSYIHYRYRNDIVINEQTLYKRAAFFTVLTFIFFAFTPLPRAYYPELFFHRPEELLPALFFSFALYGYFVKGKWKSDAFEFWLTLALLVSVIAQIVFMSFSMKIFDVEFDFAHLLKKVSYLFVLIGLLVSIYRLVLNERMHREKLGNALSELREQKYALDEHAIVDIIDIKGTITYINDKFVDISGYSRKELIGMNHKILNSGEHSDSFWKDMYGSISNKRTWHGEVCNKRKDGSLYWLETTIVPFLDEGGKPQSYISIRTDITQRKEAEISLHKKDKQLIEQSRLAQMGEMISMIAHQWRQPLGSIAATSIDMKLQIELELYNLEEPKGREDCKKHFSDGLETIESLTQHLTTTIDDFRNFYKPNKASRLISIDEPIQKSLSIVKTSMKNENITLVEDYESVKKLELFDSEIMQVFLNIFKNSQDNFKLYSTDAATIWISTKDTENGVEIIIRDNGGGIQENIIGKIFDPYFSTKNKKNGTGMGLYMSKIIIEDHHNGVLKAVNKDDGVSFRILIPNMGESL